MSGLCVDIPSLSRFSFGPGTGDDASFHRVKTIARGLNVNSSFYDALIAHLEEHGKYNNSLVQERL